MTEEVVTLSGDMRTGDAAGLRERLQSALDAGDMRIETADLASVDCAVVQVLIAARRSAALLQRKLNIDSPEEGTLAAALERMALADALAG